MAAGIGVTPFVSQLRHLRLSGEHRDVVFVYVASDADELAFRAQPKEIAKRQTESARLALTDATRTADGDLRSDRVAMGLGGLGGLLVPSTSTFGSEGAQGMRIDWMAHDADPIVWGSLLGELLAERAGLYAGRPHLALRLDAAGGAVLLLDDQAVVVDVDELGLDRLDRAVLNSLIRGHGGGPVGVSTLAIAVGEEPGTVEEVCEPYLVRAGLMSRTGRGRVATAAAWHHVGLTPPPEAPGQLNLL